MKQHAVRIKSYTYISSWRLIYFHTKNDILHFYANNDILHFGFYSYLSHHYFINTLVDHAIVTNYSSSLLLKCVPIIV